MGQKPIAIGACGALVGPKFKVTATRYEAGRPEEIITIEDYSDTSTRNMAKVMEGLSRGVVIPQQLRANERTGHPTKSAIITGWAPGEFFTDLDEVIQRYPRNTEVLSNYDRERDRGYIQQAVYNAYQASGMDFNDYHSACRAVAENPMNQEQRKSTPVNKVKAQWLLELIKNYSNGGERGKDSLTELQKFIYNKGKKVVQSLRDFSQERGDPAAFERMSRFDPNDPTIGNRFSLVGFDQYGITGKFLIKLPGMRKAFADGMRDEMGFPRDENGNHTHVLCPKVRGADHEDRPLVNVAGAILNQTFIKDGHITINDLHKPYA